MKCLTDDARSLLEKAHSFVLELIHRLGAADIFVHEILLLNQHHDNFAEVIQAVVDSSKQLMHSLHLRTKELEAFKKLADDVAYCLLHCQKLLNLGKTKLRIIYNYIFCQR